jgi:hypothetical protein
MKRCLKIIRSSIERSSVKNISWRAYSVALWLHSVVQEPQCLRVDHRYYLPKSQLAHLPILYISKALQDETKVYNLVHTQNTKIICCKSKSKIFGISLRRLFLTFHSPRGDQFGLCILTINKTWAQRGNRHDSEKVQFRSRNKNQHVTHCLDQWFWISAMSKLPNLTYYRMRTNDYWNFIAWS